MRCGHNFLFLISHFWGFGLLCECSFGWALGHHLVMEFFFLSGAEMLNVNVVDPLLFERLEFSEVRIDVNQPNMPSLK